MNYITNNTYKKIFSNFTIKEIENRKYDTQLIDFDFELIKKVKDFFKNSENIQIMCFHKFNNENYLNSKEKEYGTYHSKEDCKILKSDFQDIKVPSELIEITIAQNKDKNDEEIEKHLIFEISKFKKIAKNHFLNLQDFKSSKNAFENEINEVWGIECEVEMLFANNSGCCQIENTELDILDYKIQVIVTTFQIMFKNEISKDEILLIILNLFLNDKKLEYSKIIYTEYEDKILKYYNSQTEDYALAIKNSINLYFKIIFNKSIPFERNLFIHLNLGFCYGDCGVEMFDDILTDLLNEKQ